VLADDGFHEVDELEELEQIMPITEMDAIIRMAEFMEAAAKSLHPPATDVSSALATAIERARLYQERRRVEDDARARRRHS
jgi:hypothetical protein